MSNLGAAVSWGMVSLATFGIPIIVVLRVVDIGTHIAEQSSSGGHSDVLS
jgi:hypothetical protein